MYQALNKPGLSGRCCRQRGQHSGTLSLQVSKARGSVANLPCLPELLLFGDPAGSLGHIYLIVTYIMIIINKLNHHLFSHSMSYGLNCDSYEIPVLKAKCPVSFRMRPHLERQPLER